MEEFAGFPLERDNSDDSLHHRQTKRRTKTGTIYKGNRRDEVKHSVAGFAGVPIVEERTSDLNNIMYEHTATTEGFRFPVAESVFMEFSRTAATKLGDAMRSPVMYKVLQRGSDVAFDQLLATMRAVSQFAVTAACKRLLAWRRIQIEVTSASIDADGHTTPPYPSRCRIAIDYMFCRAVIEIMSKDDGEADHELTDEITTELTHLVFNSVAPEPGVSSSLQIEPDSRDSFRLTRLFAQLLSNVARTRFEFVKEHFFATVKSCEGDAARDRCVALIGSMTFMPLKLYPVDELERGFNFLEECSAGLKSANGSKIRHAWAGLLVELLTPIAATVNSEVNLQVFRKFVDGMFQYLVELLKKSKHMSAILPLTTAVLSIAQKDFFLEKWQSILTMCLATLKNSRASLQEAVAECAVRLAWVYTVRSSTESNQATQAKLKMIADAFFPGGKNLAPRQLPNKVFVRLILYMAKGHFDFTLRQVVLNLLAVDSSHNKISNYDRVAVGVRGFLVIANNLEIDDGPPLAPLLHESLPSGHSVRPKTELLTTLLTRETSLRLGLAPYLEEVQSKLLKVLQILDTQVVRPYSRSISSLDPRANVETLGKERSQAMDLLKTCLIAVPRCLQLTEQSFEVVQILFRCTISINDEVKKIAVTTLQTLIVDRTDLREQIVWHYTEFIVSHVPVSDASLTQGCLRILLKLMHQWKRAVEAAIEKEVEQQNTEAEDDALVGIRSVSVGTRNLGGKTSLAKNEVPPVVNLATAESTTDPNPSFRGRTKSEPPKSSVAKSEWGRKGRHSMKKLQAKLKQTEEKPLAPTPQTLFSMIEGVGLASLFSAQPATRKTCLLLLQRVQELRGLLKIELPPNEMNLYDLIHDAAPEKYTISSMQRRAESFEVASFPEMGSDILAAAADIDEPASAGSLYALASIEPFSWSDDIWLSCLADIINAKLLGPANTAIEYSWHCTCQRLTVILPVLGIGMKGDSLKRGDTIKSGSVLFMSEELRENALRALMATCTAVSAQLPILLSINDDILASVPTQFSGADSFCHNQPFPNSRDYIKFAVSLLQEDSRAIQELALFSLHWIDNSSYAAFSDELQPLVKESLTIRSESSKKKKRRDRLRIILARVHSQTSEPAGRCIRDSRSEAILTSLEKYITGTRSYLEIEGENENPDLDQLRIHFTIAIASMCRNIADLDVYVQLFTDEVRTDLFALFSIWCQASVNTSQTDDVVLERSDNFSSSIRHRAVEAIASLCRGPVFDRAMSVEGPCYLLTWLENMLASAETACRSAATEALLHLLEGNLDGILYRWAIQLCYTAEVAARKQVFLALVNMHEESKMFRAHGVPNLCLALHMLADESHESHVEARRMLALLIKQHYGVLIGEEFPLIYSSSVQTTRTYYQTIVGRYLASKRPEAGYEMLSEMFKQFQTTSTLRQQQLVQCIVPWLEVLDLVKSENKVVTEEHPEIKSISVSRIILYNLMFIYAKFGKELPLDGLWKALLATPGNLKYLINFLIVEGDSRVAEFTGFAQEVCSILSEIDAEATVAALLEHMETLLTAHMYAQSDMLPTQLQTLLGSNNSEKSSFRQMSSESDADLPPATSFCLELDKLLPRTPATIAPLFSCTVWLVGEIIARLPDFDWKPQMPTVLHFAILGLDHPNRDIHLRAKTLLLNFLLVSASNLESTAASLDKLVRFLRDTSARSLSVPTSDGGFALAPRRGSDPDVVADLSTFILEICGILEPVVPGLNERWATKAHACATSCAISYYAGRSFQVMRIFRSGTSQKSLDSVLLRLVDVAADNGSDIQGYTKEILLTLESIVIHIHAKAYVEEDAMVVPYIFWAAVALLESDYEEEYHLAVRILLSIEKTKYLDSPEHIKMISRLYEQFEWEQDFVGFYVLVCKGLASCLAGADSFTLCWSLLTMAKDDVLDPNPQASFTCAVVVMLIAVVSDFETRPESVCAAATAIAKIALDQGSRLISKMFSLWADDNYFRAKENWIKDVCKHLSKECFPMHESMMLTVLVSAFNSGDPVFRSAITSILVSLIPHVTTPSTIALFNKSLLPKILEIVEVDSIDMSALVDAIASACARADAKAPASYNTALEALCPRVEQRWDRPKLSQDRVRHRLSLVLKTLGFISGSTAKLFRLSDTTGIAPFEKEEPPPTPSPAPPHKANDKGLDDTKGLDAEEERFFEDFDFLDDELPGANEAPETAATSDGDSDGIPVDQWQDNRAELDIDSITEERIPQSVPAFDMSFRQLSAQLSVGLDIDDPSLYDEATESSSQASSAPPHMISRQNSLPLTAENLQSLSRVSLSSSTRSGDDLLQESTRDTLDDYVHLHVLDESACELLKKHVDAIVLDNDPDSGKIIWQVARKAVKATLTSHLKFIVEEGGKHDLPMLSEITATVETFLNILILPYVFVDSALMRNAHMIDSIRMIVMELQTSITTLYDQRTACAKLFSSINDTTTEAEKWQVVLSLTKMNLQSITILGWYNTFVDVTRDLLDDERITNYSSLLNENMLSIQQALKSSEEVQAKRIDTSSLSKLRAVQYLQDNIVRKRVKQSIALLRAFRKSWPGDVFGHSESDDMDVLMTICAYTENRSNATNCLIGVAVSVPTISDMRKKYATSLVQNHRMAMQESAKALL